MPINEMGDFTFNTSFFVNGIKKIGESMQQLPGVSGKIVNNIAKSFTWLDTQITKFENKVSNIAKKMSKPIRKLDPMFKKFEDKFSNIGKSGKEMAKKVSDGMSNMIMKAGILILTLKGIQGILNQMPEIGQAFGIAKDVFMKNLLYPLRKAVFPYLQKMLDWVRDNRQRFVKWGQVVANVFSVIANAVKNVINVGKNLTRNFLGFFNTVFGTQVKDLTELMNLLTFKFAVVITMLQAMAKPLMEFLQPLIDTIAIGLGGALKSATAFAEGFFKAINGIQDPIQNIFKNIKEIVTQLFTANEQGNSLQTIFSKIGEIFGSIVKFVVNITDGLIKGMKPAILSLVDPIQNIFDYFDKIYKNIFSSEKSLRVWKTTFNVIGKILGGVILASFKAVELVISSISKSIELIVSGIEKLKEFFGAEKVKTMFGKKETTNTINTESERQTNPVISSRSKNITNTVSKEMNKRDINIDFSGMQIVIPNASKEEVNRVSKQLVESMRDELAREFETMGY